MLTYMYIDDLKDTYNECKEFDEFIEFVGLLLMGLLFIPMALIIDIVTSPLTLLTYLLFTRRKNEKQNIRSFK